MFFKNPAGLAQFSPEKMAKSDLVSGASLFAGLNSFAPGQEHAMHSHAGQDKLYVILRGQAVVRVGDVSEVLSTGDVAFAASGVPHGIRNEGTEQLVVMAVLAPPPR